MFLIHTLIHTGLNGIEIMGPLEAVEGQNIEIFCTTQQGVDANSLTFQYNGSMSSDRITTLFSNTTQHNLLFGPTSKDDNGVPVACSFAEFSSTTEVLNIFCELLILAQYNYVTISDVNVTCPHPCVCM